MTRHINFGRVTIVPGTIPEIQVQAVLCIAAHGFVSQERGECTCQYISACGASMDLFPRFVCFEHTQGGGESLYSAVQASKGEVGCYFFGVVRSPQILETIAVYFN